MDSGGWRRASLKFKETQANFEGPVNRHEGGGLSTMMVAYPQCPGRTDGSVKAETVLFYTGE